MPAPPLPAPCCRSAACTPAPEAAGTPRTVRDLSSGLAPAPPPQRPAAGRRAADLSHPAALGSELARLVPLAGQGRLSTHPVRCSPGGPGGLPPEVGRLWHSFTTWRIEDGLNPIHPRTGPGHPSTPHACPQRPPTPVPSAPAPHACSQPSAELRRSELPLTRS